MCHQQIDFPILIQIPPTINLSIRIDTLRRGKHPLPIIQRRQRMPAAMRPQKQIQHAVPIQIHQIHPAKPPLRLPPILLIQQPPHAALASNIRKPTPLRKSTTSQNHRHYPRAPSQFPHTPSTTAPAQRCNFLTSKPHPQSRASSAAEPPHMPRDTSTPAAHSHTAPASKTTASESTPSPPPSVPHSTSPPPRPH